MRVRPGHIWWLGAVLFMPSCLLWAYFSVSIMWRFKELPSLDWYGVTHWYLPLFAAVCGLCLPLVCLRHLRHLSIRATLLAFVGYLTFMLTWGVLDIKSENYQVGGHDYPNGILVDGHRYYWHVYLTWYFLPYRWIHGYDFDSLPNQAMHRTAAPRFSFDTAGLFGRWIRSQSPFPAAVGDRGR